MLVLPGCFLLLFVHWNFVPEGSYCLVISCMGLVFHEFSRSRWLTSLLKSSNCWGCIFLQGFRPGLLQEFQIWWAGGCYRLGIFRFRDACWSGILPAGIEPEKINYSNIQRPLKRRQGYQCIYFFTIAVYFPEIKYVQDLERDVDTQHTR